LSVSEDGPPVAGENIVLQGTVSRVSLERKTGHVFATIFAGDHSFTVRLTPQQSKEHTIFPGKTVFISYRLDQIKWI